MTKLLGHELDAFGDEDDLEDAAEQDDQHAVAEAVTPTSDFKDFTEQEIASLNRCLGLLQECGNRDPKLEAIRDYLLGMRSDTERRWMDLGCILFSQYYDTVRWIGDELAKMPEFANVEIGLYAGSNRSGHWRGGRFDAAGVSC